MLERLPDNLSAMEKSTDALKQLQSDAMRKLGRNVLLFQEIERLMKFLLLNSHLEAGPRGLSPETLKRQSLIRDKSMGEVRKLFFEELFAPEEGDSENDAALSEIRIRTTVRFSKGDGEQFLRNQERFSAMNIERNDLVHHFLDRCNFQSAESLQTAIEHLDIQCERTIPLRDDLNRLFDQLQSGRQALMAFVGSDEGQRHFELIQLQNSKIVSLLAGVTQQLTRKDGWTLLDAAASLIGLEAPEELPAIKKRFGYRNLKALVTAAEIFELSDEMTLGGGRRTLYRVRPGAVTFVNAPRH
jgi:hypothetical protein